MSRMGRVDIKTFHSVLGKFRYVTIGIIEAKGIFTPVNSVLGRELSTVNLAKSIAVRELVKIQEGAAEPTQCTYLMPGEPRYQ